MIRKLRLKFIIVNMSIVTVLLACILSFVYSLTLIQMENKSIRALQKTIALSYTQDDAPAQKLESRLPYVVLQITPDHSWELISSHNFDCTDQEFMDSIVAQALDSTKRTGNLTHHALRYCRIQYPGGDRLMFSDISKEQDVMHSLRYSCLALGVIGFFLFLGISILLSHWAIKPVDAAMKQQQQFIADASHELKTPLTVIMTNAELLQDPSATEAARRRCVDGILSMSQRMKDMTNQLLQLARLDAPLPQENLSELNFSELIEDEILPYEPLFFEKGLTLASEIQPDIRLNGSSQQLRQLLGILLDNAQKYCIPQGIAQVVLSATRKNRCVLTVANQGTPLTPEQCRQSFQRFYRIEASRGGESFGLGLAIAKGITEQHNGKIWVESKNGYNLYHAEFPRL